MEYTKLVRKLVRDHEMKNGKLENENIEVMYNSIDTVDELDDLGYERLPLNNNHIVGWKN